MSGSAPKLPCGLGLQSYLRARVAELHVYYDGQGIVGEQRMQSTDNPNTEVWPGQTTAAGQILETGFIQWAVQAEHLQQFNNASLELPMRSLTFRLTRWAL